MMGLIKELANSLQWFRIGGVVCTAAHGRFDHLTFY